jgi:5,10-methenyltetrahydromethanopterin hydrogenase
VSLSYTNFNQFLTQGMNFKLHFIRIPCQFLGPFCASCVTITTSILAAMSHYDQASVKVEDIVELMYKYCDSVPKVACTRQTKVNVICTHMC